jgi:hypothetical protein
VDILAPDFESPFFAAARSEDAKRIAGALGALEPIYREALLLRFQEVSRTGLSHACSPKTHRVV